MTVRFNGRAPAVDLTALDLEAGAHEWLAERLGTLAPKTTELDALEQASDLTPSQQRLLKNVRAALRHDNVKADPTSVATTNEARDQNPVFFMRNARVAHGEPEDVVRTRFAMPEGLWGHEHALEAFVRVAKDWVSEARLTPAMLALGGDVGHGKDQAVATLAHSLFEGGVHHVSLQGLQDRDADSLFSGALSIDELKKLAKKKVIHVTGMDNLLKNAPAIARGLQERLLARRGEDAFADVVWVFDYDAARITPGTIAGSLGAVGARCISAKTEFERLDAPTMQRYALARLPQLLDTTALRNVRIDFDGEALELLGQALATPHAPLDELDARLLRLILTHLDTQTSVDRGRGTSIRVSLAPEMSDAARADMIANLVSTQPDLIAAESLFNVRETGRSQTQTLRDALQDTLWQAYQASEKHPELEQLLGEIIPLVSQRIGADTLELITADEISSLLTALASIGTPVAETEGKSLEERTFALMSALVAFAPVPEAS